VGHRPAARLCLAVLGHLYPVAHPGRVGPQGRKSHPNRVLETHHHPARLNRDLTSRFGSAAYAMEELIAELGAPSCVAPWG
jgi:hypothetical protein